MLKRTPFHYNERRGFVFYDNQTDLIKLKDVKLICGKNIKDKEMLYMQNVSQLTKE